MIKTEFYKQTQSHTLVRTYSDTKHLIKKTNSDYLYIEAIDIGYYNTITNSYHPKDYKYVETEYIIQPEEDESLKEKEEV